MHALTLKQPITIYIFWGIALNSPTDYLLYWYLDQSLSSELCRRTLVGIKPLPEHGNVFIKQRSADKEQKGLAHALMIATMPPRVVNWNING
jgi:hypothetical protein